MLLETIYKDRTKTLCTGAHKKFLCIKPMVYTLSLTNLHLFTELCMKNYCSEAILSVERWYKVPDSNCFSFSLFKITQRSTQKSLKQMSITGLKNLQKSEHVNKHFIMGNTDKE